MNKVLKRITKNCNFKNVGQRILDVWSTRSAFLLSKCTGDTFHKNPAYNTPWDLPWGNFYPSRVDMPSSSSELV